MNWALDGCGMAAVATSHPSLHQLVRMFVLIRVEATLTQIKWRTDVLAAQHDEVCADLRTHLSRKGAGVGGG